MIIFQREVKRNFKSFTIWTVLMLVMFIYMAYMYPSMADPEQAEKIQDFIKAFPEGFLKSFNIDIMMNLDDVTSYFAGEGYVFWLLFGSIYSMILASGILSKEESDKTAEFLLSKPVKRNTVVTAKLLNVFFYIFSFNFVLSLGSYISCEIVKTDKFSRDMLVLLCVGAFLVQLTFAAVGFLISVFVVKTKSVIPIAIGVVLGTYFLNSLAGMTEKTENFKYLTPFKYVDARDILTDKSLNPVYLLIISAVIVVSIVMTYVFYNRKDIRN